MNSSYGFGYGEDAKQCLLDDARELRLQLEHEERMMRPEINRATTMLFRARLTPINNADVDLLAREIVAVASEIAGPEGDYQFFIGDGALELETRIGGIHALPAYLKALQRKRA